MNFFPDRTGRGESAGRARAAQPSGFARAGAGAALIAGALLLSGCVEKVAEHRVRTALVDAGLPDDVSTCMARRMVDRLTIAQLRKLRALQGPRRTVPEYVDAVRRIGDREVLEVTSSSAVLCATGFG